MANAFELAADEAKRLERKVVSYSPYKGNAEIESTIDLEPKDYVDLNYSDLLNMYERTEKILSTVGMLQASAQGALIAGTPAPSAGKSAKSEEVESKLKEITSESLQKAEEIAKEPMAAAPIPARGADLGIIEEIHRPEIELEREPAKMEIEFEERSAKQAPEIERPPQVQKEEEKEIEKPEGTTEGIEIGEDQEKPPEVEKPEGALGIEKEKTEREAKEKEISPPITQAPSVSTAPSALGEKRRIMAAVPPALRESPDEAAAKRYGKIEEQIMATLGGATDEVSLKKKMLELTKELFKEKSVNRREQIKLEITVLKNMLSSAQEGGIGKKRAKKDVTAAAHGKVLDTIISAQDAEISQTKDTIIDSYKKQVNQTKEKFYNEISNIEDPAERKKALDTVLFSLTSLLEQLPEVIKNYEDFAAKKHLAELEKLRDSLDPGEKDVENRARERMELVKDGYVAEFGVVKAIIAREIDTLMDEAAMDVFQTPSGEAEGVGKGAAVTKGAGDRETVKEINRTDEGTLLSYLNSKDPDYYKKYANKQISRAEALMRSKAIMGKERGLPKESIDKYFGLGAI